MKIVNGAVVAGLVALVAPVAHAQDAGWYFGAEMGAVFASDADTRIGGVGSDIEYDPGFGLLGQVGGTLPYNFRLEAELGWRRNDVDALGGASAGGDINLLSLMGNLYYDIPTGTAFTPYIGAGLGGAHAMLDAPGIDDENDVWAYQGIAGVDYRISEALSLKADYRYFATDDFDVRAANGSAVETEYASHNIMIGFTYRFGAEPKKEVAEPARVAPTPAPPPPAPPPAPTNYMVFFDWDKADLTPEAQAVLRKAADSIRQGQAARVSLVGHADRSGPDRYNLRLSERRANNVKSFLAGLGIAPDVMGVSAKGESSPLVPTPDGVREPQNRRVEIVLP